MAFDFSTLVTDRTQQDVAYAKQLIDKLVTGTATDAEKAEWDSFTLKGAYNHTDLNRVTAAMEDLKSRLEGYGYSVPGYQRIQVPHPVTGGGSRLPDGYMELAWIESTGTQYIDTRFKPNNNTGVEIKFNIPTDFSDKTEIFGARNSSIYFELLFYTSGSMYLQFGSQLPNKRFTVGDFDLKLDGGKLYDKTNGSLLLDASAAGTFQLNQTLYLFAMHNASGGVERQIKSKLYSCQIYDNGALIRDYVPCINPNGEVGLFDMVNEQFYGNAGTGTFVAGNRVGVVLPDGYTKLAYIKSTGVQYVDTGWSPTAQNVRYIIDFSTNDLTGSAAVAGGAVNQYFPALFKNGNASPAFWVGSSSALCPISIEANKRTTVDVGANSGTLRVMANGTTQTASYAGTISTTYPAIIFAQKVGTSAATQFASMTLYSFRMYDNDVLVRDYIPCINPDGEVGLYDLVTAAFFGNGGTGAFVAGTIPRELPEGYTQVEYIESSGTQYINTGFNANNTTRVSASFAPIDSSSICVFGARGSGGNSAFMLYGSGSCDRAYGSSYVSTGVSFITGTKNVADMNGAGKTLTINGTNLNLTSQSSFTTPCPLFLFAFNDNGSLGGIAGAVRIYSCQIYDNGTLVRDYVPCKNSGGVFGLYDIVNDVFYQNAGSGVFTSGEEVAPPADVPTVEDYAPYLWYEFDWPTTEAMTVYLLNVSAIRAVLAVMESTPSVPVDMVGLMAQEANNIEVILMEVYRQINIMATTFIPCGEALCGGDNL